MPDIKERKDCPMRHENGNCQPAGGFCTAVNDPICEALHNAYDTGWRAAALWARQEAEREKNEPLTLDELRQLVGEPVWVQSPGLPEYGRWAIVEGVDTTDGDKILYLHDDFTCHEYGRVWLAYRHKPKEVGVNG